MHRYYLQLLVALVSCVSLTQKAWCETTIDEVPSTPPEKGKFYQTHVFGERPRGCSVVYSADASAMSSTWRSSDFRFFNDVYTTGAYFENKIYSAESPTIHIPTVTYSDRLYVCLEEMFEVESSYDYVWVDVTTDGGNVWNRIYGKSGYTEGMVIDYLDVSFLSGKDAIFKISLKSDSSFTGAGWDIKKFEVLSHVRNAQNEERKSQLRSGDVEPIKNPDPVNPGAEGGDSGSEGGQSGSEGGQSGTEENPEITVNKLKILNVQWESKDEGVISFSALDDQEKFVENIDLKDIKVVIKKNGTPIKEISGSSGCLSFDKEIHQKMVDIVLAVDYSSSMAGPIRELRNSVLSLCDKVKKNGFDPRFALLQYGVDNYEYLDAFNPNVKYVNSFSEKYFDGGSFWCVYKDKFFYDYNILKEVFQLCTYGGTESAYKAICEAANVNKYRENSAKVIILLFDYDIESPDCGFNGVDLSAKKNNLLKEIEGFQLFAITDEIDGNKSYFDDICNSTGGYHAFNSFKSYSNSYIELNVGENVTCENNYVTLTPTVSGAENIFHVNSCESPISILINNLNCANLHSHVPVEIGNTENAFSEIVTKISDNLNNRHYLRISHDCLENILECGSNYEISIEIGKTTDESTTKYVYPGAIVRDPETSKYDDIEKHCLESDFPVKFSIAGGCDNAVYGDAKVVYMYPDDPEKTTHTLDKDKIIKLNNNYYSTSIPLDGHSGIKYRIEVSQKDGNDVVFPAQYGFLDGFWNVYACNSGTIHPKIVNPKVECVSSGDTKQIKFSVGIDNAVEKGEVHLFFNSAGSETSSAFDHIILKSIGNNIYSSENINLREGKEYFDYYVLYVDATSKSILANYGNGHDNINRVKVSSLGCKDVCHNISLSSHVLEEDNDVLSFDIYDGDEKVEILLCDTMGENIISKQIAVSSSDKEKSVSLISELDLRSSKYHLKYTMPYILVLKIGEKVHYMYVYLGRKKR
ncbi:MAG: VWA domain-containing protein [Paludibacteraceae bacterium]|nr:VWA domain-containing protein [Paludibacteraceae bacterium]